MQVKELLALKDQLPEGHPQKPKPKKKKGGGGNAAPAKAQPQPKGKKGATPAAEPKKPAAAAKPAAPAAPAAGAPAEGAVETTAKTFHFGEINTDGATTLFDGEYRCSPHHPPLSLQPVVPLSPSSTILCYRNSLQSVKRIQLSDRSCKAREISRRAYSSLALLAAVLDLFVKMPRFILSRPYATHLFTGNGDGGPVAARHKTTYTHAYKSVTVSAMTSPPTSESSTFNTTRSPIQPQITIQLCRLIYVLTCSVGQCFLPQAGGSDPRLLDKDRCIPHTAQEIRGIWQGVRLLRRPTVRYRIASLWPHPCRKHQRHCHSVPRLGY